MSVPPPATLGFAAWVRETFPPPFGFVVADERGGVGPVIAYDGRGTVLRFNQRGPDHWVAEATGRPAGGRLRGPFIERPKPWDAP